MKITDEFCYKRIFFIRDLSRPNVIFNKCEQLEFESFDSFIKNYLSIESMVNLVNLKRIIIPINSVNQISYLSGITNNTPTFLFYLQEIKPEILIEIPSITATNFGIFLDGNNVVEFKKCLETLTEDKQKEISAKLFQTHGAFRITLTSDNLNDFLDSLSEPFVTFPFFNFCDIIIQFHTFEETKLKDLHQLIYNFKLLYRVMSKSFNKVLNWKKYNDGLSDIQYSFSIMKRNGTELYIYDDKIKVATKANLPEYECSLLNQDGNFVNQKVLDTFLGAVTMEYDCNYFVSKEENYFCNNNITSLPYLNRILCNILEYGYI